MAGLFLQSSQQMCSSLSVICRSNELRKAPQVASSLQTRKLRAQNRSLSVEASFKDVMKSVVRFAANTPIKFFIRKLDDEIERAEDRIKEGAAMIKATTHTVEKLAEVVGHGAEGVEELVEKVAHTAEYALEEIDEVLDAVDEQKQTVKVFKEKVEEAVEEAEKKVEKIKEQEQRS